MTGAQITLAEQRMQQQWHDLVMAEQAGKPLEILEQMYDRYILYAEAYNANLQAYQYQQQPSPIRPLNPGARLRPSQQRDAKLAS